MLRVQAQDKDAGSNSEVVYSIMADDPSHGDVFVINETSGDLFLRSVVAPVGDYRLTVRARDGGSPSMLSTAVVLVCITADTPDVFDRGNAITERNGGTWSSVPDWHREGCHALHNARPR